MPRRRAIATKTTPDHPAHDLQGAGTAGLRAHLGRISLKPPRAPLASTLHHTRDWSDVRAVIIIKPVIIGCCDGPKVRCDDL